jgi:mannose-6-phosphate isomerase-like protein (cupin superfamily)
MKTNLSDKLALINDFWKPRIIGVMNGQEIKLVKMKGSFIWHLHEAEDELFLCLSGHLRIEFRDHTVELDAGELAIVPHGVEHRTSAEPEAHVLIFEPVATRNTGNVDDPDFTAAAVAI